MMRRNERSRCVGTRIPVPLLLEGLTSQLGESPQSGTLYVFFGRGGRRVKVLWWDANGYCLLEKRLHRALFVVPSCGEALTVRIDGAALGQLLRGVSKEVARKQIPAQLH